MIRHRLYVMCAACLAEVAAAQSAPPAAGTLPVACVAGSCGTAVNGFVTSGRAGATYTGTTLRVNQQTERAILSWQSFDVAADGRVQFLQPGASSIALNRIHQASPSRIFGAVEANGQIYLINQNGIVFGPTA